MEKYYVENLGGIKLGNKYTEKEFLELASKQNPTIKITGKYINLKEKISCLCTIHNYEWNGYPTSILNGSGCKYCKRDKLRNAHSLSDEEFAGRINADIIPLGKYVNQNTKILVKSKICGHKWNAYPNNLMKGSTCPICSKHYKDNEIFLDELSKITDTIIPLENYKGTNQKIECKCIICNNNFYITPHKLLSYRGCPFCGISKGESVINKFLSDYNIKFERQKNFDDLRGIKNGKLSYDFYLPDYNLFIEYQGQFHDGTADIQTDSNYEIQKEHDKRKREYAKEHNIELLEIWYWDFNNIEQILQEKLLINNKKSA